MQFADLMRLFREGQNEGRKRGYVSQGACDAEGIRLVVRALRDEMQFGDWTAWHRLNEILGAAGDDATGNQWTASTQPQLWAKKPAAAPAPQANTVVLSQGYVNQIEQSRVEAHRNPAPAPCLWRVHHQTRNGPLYVSQCDGEWRHATSDPKCPSCGKKIFFPAAAPAPVCEWTHLWKDMELRACRQHQGGFYKGDWKDGDPCPCCKAPIKFTGAKT